VHVEFGRSFKKIVEPDSPVQETILGVNMEMYEVVWVVGHNFQSKGSRGQGFEGSSEVSVKVRKNNRTYSTNPINPMNINF